MKPPSFRTLQWLFPIAVLVHNSEEALTMPQWIAAHSERLPLHPGAGVIRAGLLLLTLAAFTVTALSTTKGRQSRWAYLLFGSIVTMLLNVLVPHIPAALYFRAYTPGVLTAIVILLPVMSLLLYRSVADQWVSGARAVRYAVLVPLALAALIAALFTLA